MNSTSKVILPRGKSLYRKGNAKPIKQEVSEEQIRFFFDVQGAQSTVYSVTIDINKNGSIGSYCTCPYNFGDTCKHEVAAYLYLIDNPNFLQPVNQKKEDALKGYRKNDWYYMPNVDTITEEVIFRHVVHEKYEIYHSASLLNQKENQFEFLVKCENNWGVDDHRVLFELTDQALRTLCSCLESHRSTCEHQATVLYALAENNPDFFVEADAAESIPTKVYKQIASSLNLNEEAVQKYFDIKRGIKGYYYAPKEAYAGIKLDGDFSSVKQYTANYRTELSGNTNKELSRIQKHESTRPVLFLSPEEYEEYPALYALTGHSKISKRNPNALNKPTSQSLTHWLRREDVTEEMKTLVSRNLKHLYSSDYHFKNEDEQYEAIKNNFSAIQPLFENEKTFPQIWLFFDSYKFKDRASHWIQLSSERFRTVLEIKKSGDIVRLNKRYKLNGVLLNNDQQAELLTPITLLIDTTLHLIDDINEIKHGSFINELSEQGCLYESFPEFFHQVIAPISQHLEVEFSNFDQPVVKKKLKHMEKSLYISEFDKFLLFKPVVKYKGKNEFNPLEDGTAMSFEAGKVISKVRDQKWEQEFVDQLKSLHPKFKLQGHKGFFNLSLEEVVEGYWFLESFEVLKTAGIEVYGLKDLKNFKYATSKPQISLNVSSGMDWFDVDLKVEIENEFFTLKDLKRKLVKAENYVELGDGRLAILPEEWVEKIRKYLRIGDLNKEGQLQVSKKKFAVLEDTFEEGSLSEEILTELAEKKKKLQAFKSVKHQKLPTGIQATLRNYQIEGFNWLCFLDEFGWGGILADDMGLGKTVQVITFILHRIEKKAKKPILVVVPTSLIFNWKNEIEKFAPDINYLLHYGTDRSTDHKKLKAVQLIITSYGLMHNDLELLQKITFDYVILDESQAIKNAATSRFKSAISLKSTNRLAMTGTPIENNTFELYAQMHFTNPGFLGSAQSFKQTYSTPIDKYGDKEAAGELQKLTNPFILRRTKEIVAKELPPKTEDVIYCEMAPDQRKIYDAYRNQMRLQILDKIEEDGVNQSKLEVLQALTKLRQVCDSPALLSGDEESYEGSAVKLDILLEHIKEKTSNHKILIFSQFVKMLQLIKDRLEENELSYDYLDGSSTSKQRESSVANFQDNKDIRVFLISLKAGGTGLNLTAADYVYVVDPWWNPAVENQAIDRCYRIGQDKHVIAYRMICKDTIEDKIQQHKANKQKVADAIITTDENIMANLKKEDIMDMFS